MAEQEKSVEEQLREQRDLLERKFTENMNDVLDAMKARFGPEVADVVDELVATATRRHWAERAEKEGSNTIEDLIRLLWEPLRAEGFEFTIERREDGVQMHCTRCPLVDLAQEMGSTEWAYHFYCGSDPHIVSGFNPKMGFRRTKTLMEGHDCCDHFYFMKQE